MKSIFASLEKRRRRCSGCMPHLRWQSCLFVTVNAVIISLLSFDGPVGGENVPAALRRVGLMLTDFGKSDWIIVVSAFLLFQGWASSRIAVTARDRLQALRISCIGGYLLTSIALSGLVANLLKRLIGRARPEHFQEYGIFSFSPLSGHSFESFPSGHATTIGAFFAAFALLFPRYRIAFLACALWLGMTRVMVGAHYPSDVIAGLALGGWFSMMLATVYARHGFLFRLDGTAGWPQPKRLFPALKNPAPFERRAWSVVYGMINPWRGYLGPLFPAGRSGR
ncbi:lipid A 1-phosphatase LpxE [Rhizobium sp. AC44/96]|uniref:lipid A 1-phosphatase LpxE n=1 Tax=Rhizobium sp. AC44/96 TaxID=1841654 RepID=UPI0018E9AB70|nr:lipid A 1-phosphatase LpxE [Rhizobium sp. AC44/96]